MKRTRQYAPAAEREADVRYRRRDNYRREIDDAAASGRMCLLSGIEPSDVDSILRSLIGQRRLVSLALSGLIDDENARDIATYIAGGSFSPRALFSITSSFLTSSGVVALMDALHGIGTHDVSFGGTPVSNEHLVYISARLRSVQKLALEAAPGAFSGVVEIYRRFRGFELSLSMASMPDHLLFAMAPLVRGKPQHSLQLWLASQTTASLAAAHASSGTFDVESDAGVAAMIDAYSNAENVGEIARRNILWIVRPDDSTAAPLLKANRVTDALVRAMRINCTPESVNFSGFEWTQENRKAIYEAFRENTSLREIQFNVLHGAEPRSLVGVMMIRNSVGLPQALLPLLVTALHQIRNLRGTPLRNDVYVVRKIVLEVFLKDNPLGETIEDFAAQLALDPRLLEARFDSIITEAFRIAAAPDTPGVRDDSDSLRDVVLRCLDQPTRLFAAAAAAVAASPDTAASPPRTPQSSSPAAMSPVRVKFIQSRQIRATEY